MSRKTSKQRREQRKRALAREEGIRKVNMTYHQTPVMVGFDMFGPLMAYPAAKMQPKNGEEKMNTAAVYNQVTATESQEEKAFKRILNRMQQAFYQFDQELQKEHGLVLDEKPATCKELVERIKSGKFVIPEQYNDYRYYNPAELIEWRDPKIEKDRDGYEKAHKALDKKYQAALDKIYISTGEEGLKVFEAFEKGK